MDEITPINYTEKTTDELLSLLFDEEDRVTEAHLREVAARPDAHETLREWLQESNRWHDRGCGHWWSLYHAFMALSLNGDPAHLDDLLLALKAAFNHDFDWIKEDSTAALAQFGSAGVERLIEFVKAERPQSFTGKYVCDWRTRVMLTLTRIALDHPAEHARIADFIVGRYSDLEETDPEFLALNIDNAMLLDFERCRQVFPEAYARGAVDAELGGDDAATAIAFFESVGYDDEDLLNTEFLEFYQPDAIAERKGRWTKEPDDDDDDWSDDWDDDELLARNRSNYADGSVFKTLHAPPGYNTTSTGSVVRETKVGRNDPCPCGSGKKYKKCCGNDA